MGQAEASFKRGDVTGAFDLLSKPLDPSWKIPGLVKSSELALRMQQPSVAVSFLNSAIKIAPEAQDLYIKKGEAEAACGREQAAIESFKQVRDQKAVAFPLARVLYLYGKSLKVEEKRISALKEAEALLEQQETMGMNERVLLGAIKSSLDKDQEGADLFQGVIGEQADHLIAHFNLGLVMEKTENLKGAKKAYSDALAIDDAYSPAAYHLGCLLVDSGKKEEGLAWIKKAVDFETDPIKKQALEKAWKKKRTASLDKAEN